MDTKPRITIPSFLMKAYKDTRQFVFIRAGRRIGKTKNFVTWQIQELDQTKDDGQLMRGLWVDTTQSNIDKYIDRYFMPTLTRMNYWQDCKWNGQKKILTLWNGNTIDFGSSERPELLEGFGYDVAVINEAGIVLKKAKMWDNTIYPMVKHAKVRGIGTPKGKNKFETLCRQYPSYKFSAYDSPFWTEEEIEEAKRTMTQEAFRQEILAEFIEGAGAVFRNIRENIGSQLLDKPVDGRRYCLAADLAKHQDFTVIFIGDMDSREVVFHERFNQIDWPLQKQRIINAYNKFDCVNGVIDATGVGDAIFDDLIKEGLDLEGFKFTATTKQELVSNLSVAMDNGEIKYPEIEELINELEIYAYEQRSNGSFSYSAPEGFNDDEVMGLALLNRAMNVKAIPWAAPVF